MLLACTPARQMAEQRENPSQAQAKPIYPRDVFRISTAKPAPQQASVAEAAPAQAAPEEEATPAPAAQPRTLSNPFARRKKSTEPARVIPTVENEATLAVAPSETPREPVYASMRQRTAPQAKPTAAPQPEPTASHATAAVATPAKPTLVSAPEEDIWEEEFGGENLIASAETRSAAVQDPTPEELDAMLEAQRKAREKRAMEIIKELNRKRMSQGTQAAAPADPYFNNPVARSAAPAPAPQVKEEPKAFAFSATEALHRPQVLKISLPGNKVVMLDEYVLHHWEALITEGKVSVKQDAALPGWLLQGIERLSHAPKREPLRSEIIQPLYRYLKYNGHLDDVNERDMTPVEVVKKMRLLVEEAKAGRINLN